MEQETLTVANLVHAIGLWPDRVGHTDAEFSAVIHNASLLLAQRRAFGAFIREQNRAIAFGLTVFVDELFAADFVARPFAQMGKHLLLTAFEARTPVLTLDGIARRNAAEGLQLVVLATNIDPSFADRSRALGYLIHAFVDTHGGYQIERVFNEVLGSRNVEDIRSANVYGPLLSYRQLLDGTNLPGAIGTLSRSEAARARSTLLPLFNYSPPRLLFSAPQQELLRAALDGETDENLARRLGVSVSAVKARWTRIYERAARQLPARFGSLRDRPGDETRGAQLRHHVMKFVRANPSELTPYQAPPSAKLGVMPAAGYGAAQAPRQPER